MMNYKYKQLHFVKRVCSATAGAPNLAKIRGGGGLQRGSQDFTNGGCIILNFLRDKLLKKKH